MDDRASSSDETDAESVVIKCSKCSTVFGRCRNTWWQITNSYYLEANAGGEIHNLTPKGNPQKPDRKDLVLEDVLIQPLVCPCGRFPAFKCVSAPPDRRLFAGRVFLKLGRVKLFTLTSQQAVAPELRDRPTDLSRLQSPEPIDSSTGPLEPPNSTMWTRTSHTVWAHSPDAAISKELDKWAVDRIIRQDEWSQVHEDWEKQTRRQLSPASFGKHLMPLLEDRKAVLRAIHNITRPVSMNESNNLPNPSTIAELPANVSQQPDSQNVTSLQRELRNAKEEIVTLRAEQLMIRGELSQLQKQQIESDSIMQQLAQMRRDLSTFAAAQQASHHTQPTIDNAPLEILAETVANLSKKVVEVDTLKLSVEMLKGATRRLEEKLGNTQSQQLEPSYSPLSMMPLREQRPGHLKRRYDSAMDIASPPISLDEVDSAEHHSALEDVSDGRRSTVSNSPEVTGEVQDDSDESDMDWTPPSNNLRASDGRLMRRGFGGGPSKDTRPGATYGRLNPHRNAEGILIRKDGKPDRRSITSSRNLQRGRENKDRQAMSSPANHSPATYAPTIQGSASEKHQTVMRKVFPNGIESATTAFTQP